MEDSVQHPIGPLRVLGYALGLINGPAVFQSLFNDVLRDMLNRSVFVYPDLLEIRVGAQDSRLTGSSTFAGESTLHQGGEVRVPSSVHLFPGLHNWSRPDRDGSHHGLCGGRVALPSNMQETVTVPWIR